MNHTSRRVLFSLLGLLLNLGCGGETSPSYDRVPVKGTLTVDGEPIAYGSIGFLPDPESNIEGPAVYADVRIAEFDIPQERGPGAGQHFVEVEVYGPEPTNPEESAGAHPENVGIPGPVRRRRIRPMAAFCEIFR